MARTVTIVNVGGQRFELAIETVADQAEKQLKAYIAKTRKMRGL